MADEVWTWKHSNNLNGYKFGITFNDEYHNDVWGKGAVTFEINSGDEYEGTGEITFTKPKDIEDMAEFLTRVAKKMRSMIDANQD